MTLHRSFGQCGDSGRRAALEARGLVPSRWIPAWRRPANGSKNLLTPHNSTVGHSLCPTGEALADLRGVSPPRAAKRSAAMHRTTVRWELEHLPSPKNGSVSGFWAV